MSHHFESTWSAHKQKQHNCTHKGTDVGNFALIWSASLPLFESHGACIVDVRDHIQLCRMLFKMLFGEVSRFGSFPADCNAA